jgi:hypothetical protein
MGFLSHLFPVWCSRQQQLAVTGSSKGQPADLSILTWMQSRVKEKSLSNDNLGVFCCCGGLILKEQTRFLTVMDRADGRSIQAIDGKSEREREEEEYEIRAR